MSADTETAERRHGLHRGWRTTLGIACGVAATAWLATGTAADEADRSESVRAAIKGGPARNVILFVGDGMGDSEITAARNYAVGPGGRLALDTLPLTGAYTTYAVQEAHPELPDFVPDSAATGTAWATGRKTSNGRISTSAGDDRDLPTILEMAQQRGYRTGDVTTAELTDATPAVLGSHVAHRSCQGPANMALCPQDRKSAGGPGSIAEQLIAHRPDVLMGGGAARFEQATDGGPLVTQLALAAGYRIVTAEAGLDYVERGQRVLGLFAPGNMTVEWRGAEAVPYPANVATPQSCKEDQRPANEPSLSRMTAKAIALLDSPGSGPGFFLQVEGASIDKQDHAADPCGQIGETIAFDQAVRVGLDFARDHPDTLIVVTADHGQSSQIVGLPTDADHPSGLLSVLRTRSGAPMTMSYATNAYHRSQDHTGTQVRIAAQGPQAANVVGVIDQTEIFQLFSRALQVPDRKTSVSP
jgi:alkaline phosphatase/streptomycin-6-phosphatase